MQFSPENIKRWLRESKERGRTSFGFFAEYIYAATMMKTHEVKKVHSGGIDFLIDHKINVDVKSRICLDTKLGLFPREPDSNRLPGVAYPHVVFYEEIVVIYDTEQKRERPIKNISWEEISLMAMDYEKQKKRGFDTLMARESIMANKLALEVLVVWIQKNWCLKAKMMRRSSPIAMLGMNNSAWGPEAFYHDIQRNPAGFNLVVLVYFDGKTDYEVCAYPLNLSHEINWYPKKVGPNNNKRMTFNPRALSPKFRFDNIAHFKVEFPQRFH